MTKILNTLTIAIFLNLTAIAIFLNMKAIAMILKLRTKAIILNKKTIAIILKVKISLCKTKVGLFFKTKFLLFRPQNDPHLYFISYLFNYFIKLDKTKISFLFYLGLSIFFYQKIIG